MAETDRLDAYENWLRANKDKAGTPDFVKVAEAYRELRSAEASLSAAPAQAPAAPGWADTLGNAATGTMNMLGRVGMNVVTGGADMVSGVGNMMLGGMQKAFPNMPMRGSGDLSNDDYKAIFGRDAPNGFPYAGQALKEAVGIPEMSKDAPAWARTLETGLNVATNRRLYNGPVTSVGKEAAHIGLPTAGIELGGEAGHLVGGDVGQMLGSIAGGGGASIAVNKGLTPLKYLGNEEAGNVYDAAKRLGVEGDLTAGSVGNGGVKWTEKSLGSVPLMGWGVNRKREAMSSAIEGARDDAAMALTGGRQPDPSPGARGAALIQGSQDAERRIQTGLSAEQQALEDAVGSNTPTRVGPIVTTGERQAMSTNEGNAGPIRQRTEELTSMTPTGPAVRDPTAPINTVPYGVLKDWRTDLNAEREGMSPVAGHLVDPIANAATESMRETARFRGVEPQFDAANAAYAHAQPTLEQLRTVGGRYEGPQRGHTGGMDSGQAEGFLRRGLIGDEPLRPVVDAMDPQRWGYIAGSHVAGLGQQPKGGFRPDNFAAEWGAPNQKGGISGPGQALLTQSAPTTLGQLTDAATMGRNFNTNVAADGLSRAIGGLTAASAVGGGLLAGGGVPSLLLGTLPAFALESGPVVRGLAGRSTPLVDMLQQKQAGLRAGVVNGLYGPGGMAR